mmetsp:Transcript_89437/g.149321  ORF Transcript_89437/g.149321 Transcript_89437/m.149321 type:complete len:128 (+) Transcript_89437:216-599(+)
MVVVSLTPVSFCVFRRLRSMCKGHQVHIDTPSQVGISPNHSTLAILIVSNKGHALFVPHHMQSALTTWVTTTHQTRTPKGRHVDSKSRSGVCQRLSRFGQCSAFFCTVFSRHRSWWNGVCMWNMHKP